MKQSIVFLLLTAAALPAMGKVTVTQQRLAIDTVSALKVINQDINNKNLPIEQEIISINSAIGERKAVLQKSQNDLARFKKPHAYTGIKVKDDKVISEFVSLLPAIYSSSSTETLLSQLAKPKEIEKAQKKGETDKLIDKKWEKLTKSVSKGDFTHPFLKDAVARLIAQEEKTIRNLKEEQQKAEKDLDEAKGKLLPNVTKFDADAFYESFGAGHALPTHFITETVAYDDLQEGEDYATLVARYYNTPDKHNDFKESRQITGKFDGYIEDILGMFPLESSKYTDENYGFEEGAKTYNKILIKAKNNTVRPLIVDRRELDEHLEDLIFFTSSPACTLSDHGMQRINELWSKDTRPQDGVDVSLHPNEATINYDYTYVYENGEWKHKVPFSPKYMSYDDLLPYAKNKDNPINFTYRDVDEYSTTEIASIIMVDPSDMGAKYQAEGEPRLYFKSKAPDGYAQDNTDGDCDFSVPAKHLIDYVISKESTQRGDAIGIVYADIKNGKYKGTQIDFYVMDAECYDCFSVYNGVLTGEKMGKRESWYLPLGEVVLTKMEKSYDDDGTEVWEYTSDRLPATKIIETYHDLIKEKYGVDIRPH
ncbi:MAG: hypothetical protein HDS73_02820 [Bacteroidales bacterium]|nr:hypothetical protein [Bacteroidales bacterium]